MRDLSGHLHLLESAKKQSHSAHPLNSLRALPESVEVFHPINDDGG